MIKPQTFEQVVQQRQSEHRSSQGQQVLVNWHVAKTGGTTLYRMIESALNLHTVDMQNVEGWLDFKKNENLYQGKNLVFEGHTWGSHTLLSSNLNYLVYYVTVIRDPLLRARSVFSYNKYNYNMQSVLDEFFMQYAPNPYVYHYGDGDIELAKERLKNVVSLLFITERFEECVGVFAELFGVKFDDFSVRNRSGAEKYEIPPSIVAEFKKRNSGDYELYDFANELFDRRLEHVKRELKTDFKKKKLRQVEDQKTFPSGFKQADERVISLIGENKNQDAIAIVEKIFHKKKAAGKRTFREARTIGDLHLREQNFEKASFWYREAYGVHPSFVWQKLAETLTLLNPSDAETFLRERRNKIQGVITTEPPDSVPNKELRAIDRHLCQITFERIMAKGSKLQIAREYACIAKHKNPKTLLHAIADFAMMMMRHDQVKFTKNTRRLKRRGVILVKLIGMLLSGTLLVFCYYHIKTQTYKK